MSGAINRGRTSTRGLPRVPYPVVGGRIIAPRLEIGIAEHCNLRCRACSHVSPVLKRHTLEPAALASDLGILGRHYHVDLVRLMGGEPLLHPALTDVIAVVRQSGVADEVWVVTNGRRLSQTDDAFWRAIDGIDVSIYPGYAPTPEEELRWKRRAADCGTKLKVRNASEFRESYSELGATTDGLAQDIYDTCMVVHKWHCHTLAGGRLYKCPQAYYLAHVLAPVASAAPVDSVAIRDHPDLGPELRAYFATDRALGTCGYCLGTAGRRFPHEQVSRADFRRLQARPAEELIDFDVLDAHLLGRWQSWPRRVRRRLMPAAGR